ncbi:unnamed protein product, partial [Heterosigma akashiwo]
MSASATELQKYLSYWDKYKFIWESDKEGYIRRYAKANRSLEQFKADIEKYKEHQADVQGEDLSHTINFIKIDCVALKTDLVRHTVEWQNKLTGLLNRTALAELDALHARFDEVTAKLRVKPVNLDELSDSLGLLTENKEGLPEVEARFEPLEAKFEVLAEFEVVPRDDAQARLAELREKAGAFAGMLEETEGLLGRSKNEMRRDLEVALENYNEAVVGLRAEAKESLPYGELPVAEAFRAIEAYERKARDMRDQQARLQAGLDIFGIPSPEHKELKDVEKDLEKLRQMWGLTRDWNAAWDGWKTGVFAGLDVEEMENAAGQYNK